MKSYFYLVFQKKGGLESKTGRERYREKNIVHPEVIGKSSHYVLRHWNMYPYSKDSRAFVDDENTHIQDCEDNEDNERLSIKSSRSGDDRIDSNYSERENVEGKWVSFSMYFAVFKKMSSISWIISSSADLNDGTEEYEPSMSVPQFVVTLTGLDSKLFPKEGDADDDLVDMLDDDLEPGN